ncbi:MAG: hypothetical protein ACREE9_12260 [Stellaceae bacterium]
MATPNSQAIAAANTISSLCAQLSTLKSEIDAAVAEWVAINAAATLGAMQTVPTEADGTLSATPDSSPSTAIGHVINTGTYASLNRATSAYAYGVAENLLAAVSSMLDGNAVAANANAPDVLAAMIDG